MTEWVQPLGEDKENPASPTNPIPVELQGSSTISGNVGVLGVDGTTISSGSNPVPARLQVGTTAVSASAPVPVSATGSANAVGNPLFSSIVVNGSAVAAAKPMPVSATEAANAVGNTIFVSPVQAGAAVGVGNPLYIQGSVTTSGSSIAQTFAAALPPFTPYATPTDVVLLLGGSASKTGKLRKVTLWSTQTTSGTNDWYIIKRSTADTGGTFSAVTPVKADSTNASATCTFGKWTAAPTINATVGNLKVIRIGTAAPDATANTAMFPALIYDSATDSQPWTVRGTAEEIHLNFNGAAVPAGLTIAVTVEFTEE